MKTYTLSLADGQAQETPNIAGTSRSWSEALLQHVLALNPDLLGVGNELPIGLDGGSTMTSPDQLYVDDVGRLTVVEIKNERATVAALVQVLAYAEHWRLLPLGEMSRGLRGLTERGAAQELLGRALLALQGWARGSSSSGTPEEQLAAGEAVLARHRPFWAGRRLRSTQDAASRLWGSHGLTLPGAPARMVLIAPDFDDEVVSLARQMSRRMVGLELIQAELQVSPDHAPLLLWNRIHHHESIEPVWAAARQLWRLPMFREHLASNGWADHLTLDSFSFSLRQAPEVKIWVEHRGDKISLSTCVPDGWYEGSERKKLREELLDALPEGFTRDRWLTWWFQLPADAHTFEACALDILEAQLRVLVPHAQ